MILLVVGDLLVAWSTALSERLLVRPRFVGNIGEGIVEITFMVAENVSFREHLSTWYGAQVHLRVTPRCVSSQGCCFACEISCR